MDYCSLCRKACLVKDFWKIYIGLILSLLLKWTFYPQRHMILPSADSFCQKVDYLLFHCLLPFPFQSFKWIPLDSKWYPDFAETIFSVHLYVWYFFLSLSAVLLQGFSGVSVYGLECEMYGSALLLILRWRLLLWFLVTLLIKVAILPPWSPAVAPPQHSLSLLRSLCHSNLSPMGALQSRGKCAPTGGRTSQNGGWEGIHPSSTSDLFNSLQGAPGGKTHQA